MPNLDKAVKYFHEKHPLLLMLDYDGTLTPIADKPELAILDNETRSLLNKLADNKLIKIIIVSGRSIPDLLCVSGLQNKNILIFGLHGGQILENGKIKLNIPLLCKKSIKELKAKIIDLGSLPGIIIEDKKYSLSLHYRLADEETAKYSISIFKEKIKELGLIENGHFRLQDGKKVLEILPVNINKGIILAKIVKKYKDYFPLYFGDDKTDYYAFKEIKKYNGLAVLVDSERISIVDQVITIDELKEFLRLFTS